MCWWWHSMVQCRWWEYKSSFFIYWSPESTKEIEPYGKEASDYTKTQLTNAAKIELELNVDGDSKDKYGRFISMGLL
mgnify:CR=1 FL=1